jgi:hypothetical protein
LPPLLGLCGIKLRIQVAGGKQNRASIGMEVGTGCPSTSSTDALRLAGWIERLSLNLIKRVFLRHGLKYNPPSIR